LGSIARWLVTLVMGVFLAHHIIAADQAAYFTEGFVHQALLALPLLAPLAWSLWGKYKGRVRFLTALDSLSGTTEAAVDARIAKGMGASVKASAIVLACVLAGGAAFAASACGPKQYHTAVVANTSIAQAIFAVQDAETAAHNAGLITTEKHAAYKAQILTLLEAGDDLTLALKDWNPSLPVPANVGAAMGNVQRLLTDLQLNSPQATALLFTVQTVLSVLRGIGVLAGGPVVAVVRG
jgi:hypothetical protein